MMRTILRADFLAALVAGDVLDLNNTRATCNIDYPAHTAPQAAAHYMLRWVSTTGKNGPSSETAGATIGA